jgi:dethiobiotin synthetase
MLDPHLQRVVILGTGTGVGKTHVAAALASALQARLGAGQVLALKPVETGAPYRDAARLQTHNAFPVKPHPRYALPEPISPHLAADRAGQRIELGEIVAWVETLEAQFALCDNTLLHICACSVIETAGGALSPLADGVRNVELALAFEPACWVLVAPDALGVLHELGATITALGAIARAPDAVILSAAATPDASTGTNADELRRLGVADPLVCLGRNDMDVSALADWVSARRS